MYKIVFALLAITGIFLLLNNRNSPNPDSKQTPQPSENRQSPVQPKNSISLNKDNIRYTLIYEKVSGKNLIVISNFTEKRGVSAIAEENDCIIASSGGFYTKENKPLGLFKINGTVLSKRVMNTRLLTGFLTYENNGAWIISREPDENFPTILQSGPFFERGSNFVSSNTEMARRIIVFEDQEQIMYLGALYDETNTRSGPQLSIVPSLLFSIKQPFIIQKILNLDGGSASFFKDSNGFTLSELVTVGSILCIN